MCIGEALTIAGVGLKVASDIIGGNAQEEAQRREAEIDRQNAKLAEEQALLSGRRTEAKVAKVKEAGVRFMGKQEVALADNNLDVSTGSAAEILEGTAGVVGEEVAVVRYNGAAEAYGYRATGKQFSAQAAAHEAAAEDINVAKWLAVGADLFQGGAKIAASAMMPTPAAPGGEAFTGYSGMSYGDMPTWLTSGQGWGG